MGKLDREMVAIPISAARHIANAYGYDQVVVMARRVGEDGGEHITTYGINPTHCGVAALMGDKLKEIAGWKDVDSTAAEIARLKSALAKYEGTDIIT